MRIVVGWHSCMEAIKVRPNEISKVYLEETKLKPATQFNSNEKNKTSNRMGNNQSKSNRGHQAVSLDRNENNGNGDEAINIKDKFSFLNHKSLKNKIQYKAKSFFEKWGTGHQGIAVEIESDEPVLDLIKLNNKKSVLVALDEVEDPTNLGNLLRTSWLMGVDGLLVTQDRSVKLTPQVCKIASGGAEHVPVEVVHPLSNTLEDFKKQGFWVYGLDANADQTVYDVQFPDKVILVAGNEGKGLRKTTLNVCDQVLKIPQVSDVASLNVATSLAITLSQVQRAFLSVDDNKLKK